MASRVLVTDSEQHSALAATRSLGRAGHVVHVCGTERFSLAALSRHATEFHAVPSASDRPEAFVEAIRRLCEEHRIDVLLPTTDAALIALLPRREGISARIPWPALSVVERTMEKASLQEVARELEIALPSQRQTEVPPDPTDAGAGGLRFPVVLKPGRSFREGRQFQVSHAANAEQLRVRLAAMDPRAYPLLIQERVIGPGTGVFLLRWDGQIVARFAHRRIRENPPSGGSSVLCEAIPIDPELLALSEALLARLDWQGVAMVEYKVDAATGRPYLMELNGRFWGSLQLAVDAGVDFPALLVACALGGAHDSLPPYRTGVRVRSIWRDANHLLARLRWSRADLDLPQDAPSRWRAFADFFTWRRGDRLEVLRFDDPLPALREFLNFLRRRS